MIWTIIGILLLFWLFGNVIDFAGGFIHLILVVALIVFLYDYFTNRRRGV